MILALTGAGISKASGIPTFSDQDGLRTKLSRSFAMQHRQEFQQTIYNMTNVCKAALPNDAHYALAEYHVPVITMNVDRLHQKAGTEHILPIHGLLPEIVLYGDPAPLYEMAHNWVFQLRHGDVFLIVGTSFYTMIATQLKISAIAQGAEIVEINEDAEHQVRRYLEENIGKMGDGSFENFIARDPDS